MVPPVQTSRGSIVWQRHYAVRDRGRIYDATTGADGMAESEYMTARFGADADAVSVRVTSSAEIEARAAADVGDVQVVDSE